MGSCTNMYTYVRTYTKERQAIHVHATCCWTDRPSHNVHVRLYVLGREKGILCELESVEN